MPLIVDHDERRKFVCDVAARLISRAGLAGVTVRDVAAEAGCSTRVVSHYFRNKRELLLCTFHEYAQRSLDACEAMLHSDRDLAGCLEGLLPCDEAGKLNWQVWLAFWGIVADDPEFLAEQVRRGQQIREMVSRLIESRRGPPPQGQENWSFAAEFVVNVVVGIATQGTFDPEHWTPERQRRHLRAALEKIY